MDDISALQRDKWNEWNKKFDNETRKKGSEKRSCYV
jgi:hypothetical protein